MPGLPRGMVNMAEIFSHAEVAAARVLRNPNRTTANMLAAIELLVRDPLVSPSQSLAVLKLIAGSNAHDPEVRNRLNCLISELELRPCIA